MPGPYPDDSNNQNLIDMRVAANTLEKLLGLLSIDVATIELLTWQIIKTRYQHTGLSELALQNIENQKRIIYAARQYEHIGIFEFHIGLIYLHWGEPEKALPYFATAQRYWELVNQTAAACLALFAQGYMHFFNHVYEDAMVNFLRTQHGAGRLKGPIYREVNKTFIAELETAVKQAISTLRTASSQIDFAGPGGTARIEEVFTPIVPPPSQPNPATAQSSLTNSPIPGHLIIDDQLVWYRIQRIHADGFLPDVLPDDWVLVKKSPANEHLTTNDLIVIADPTLNSSIRLTSAKTSTPNTTPKVFVGRMIEPQKRFTRDTSGNIHFSNVQISEQQLAPVDFENIVGVVLGFWTSNVKP